MVQHVFFYNDQFTLEFMVHMEVLDWRHHEMSNGTALGDLYGDGPAHGEATLIILHLTGPSM